MLNCRTLVDFFGMFIQINKIFGGYPVFIPLEFPVIFVSIYELRIGPNNDVSKKMKRVRLEYLDQRTIAGFGCYPRKISLHISKILLHFKN